MLDYLGNTLCVGDRVIFTSSNDRGLLSGQVTGFKGEEPYRQAVIMTDKKRETTKRQRELVKEPV